MGHGWRQHSLCDMLNQCLLYAEFKIYLKVLNPVIVNNKQLKILNRVYSEMLERKSTKNHWLRLFTLVQISKP